MRHVEWYVEFGGKKSLYLIFLSPLPKTLN